MYPFSSVYQPLFKTGIFGSSKTNSDESRREENRSLLEAASIEEAGAIVGDYVESQQEDVIDTSNPDLKSVFRFELLGIGLELMTAAVLFALCGKYFSAGCLITGFSVLGLGLSVSYLSIPQAIRPFVTNPIIRWFIVTNHSTQITAMFGILMGFVFISYFSWFNSCDNPLIHKGTISVLSLTSLAIAAFLVACYRDENGNGGYLKWLFKFFI